MNLALDAAAAQPAALAHAENPGRLSSALGETPGAAPVRAMLVPLKLVSYFPARNGWEYMWSNWDLEAMDRDFAQLASFGFNSVRIIVQAPTIGYPRPSQLMLDRLSRTIGLAASHGLRVQLTLFDWWSDYEDIDGSRTWASAVLAGYRGDSRIAYIDIQNEANTTDSRVTTWLQHIAPFVKERVGSIPVTSSVNTIERLRALVHANVPVDLYDFHFYYQPELAYRAFMQARQVVGPVPLFVGEAGYSTYVNNRFAGGLPPTPGAQEAFQEQFHRTIQYAAHLAGLPMAAPWIFKDFASDAMIPPPIDSYVAERSFGLFRTDGTPKPAAGTLARVLRGEQTDLSFNNGFELSDESGLPTYWRLHHLHQARFSRDPTVSRSGGASGAISRSGGDDSSLPAFFLTPVAPIAAETSYTVSAWVRGESATGLTRIALAWFDEAGSYIGSDTSPNAPLGTIGWQQLAVTAVAPETAAGVQIHLQSAFNSGTAWFDDVVFNATASAPATAAPSPTASASGTPLPTMSATTTPTIATTPAPTAPTTPGLGATATPGQYAGPVACSPRPPVALTTSRDQDGTRLRVVIRVTGDGNRIRHLQIGATQNASIDVVGGPAGVTDASTFLPPPGTTQLQLSVRRVAPGPMIVPFTVVDDCGEWTTFAGTGAG
ncbi:MAG: hypothetical protein IT193_06040 [Propionibacteriaceae bacterium]|nr:hypothetical protein [Propionibacteriaceae bacterium]